MSIWDFVSQHWFVAIVLALIAGNVIVAICRTIIVMALRGHK